MTSIKMLWILVIIQTIINAGLVIALVAPRIRGRIIEKRTLIVKEVIKDLINARFRDMFTEGNVDMKKPMELSFKAVEIPSCSRILYFAHANGFKDDGEEFNIRINEKLLVEELKKKKINSRYCNEYPYLTIELVNGEYLGLDDENDTLSL